MARHTLVLVPTLLLLASPRARADNGIDNWLVGPILGIQIGSASGHPEFGLGIEGGAGLGPERLNLGFEWRTGPEGGLAYIQLEPWYWVGGTFGVGVDTHGAPHPVVGLWEGLPLKVPGCAWQDTHGATQLGPAVTLAAGYRFTGVHELYFSVKAGGSQSLCLD